MDVQCSGNSRNTVVLKWKSYGNVALPKWGCYGNARAAQRASGEAARSLSRQVYTRSNVPSWGTPAAAAAPKWRIYSRGRTAHREGPRVKAEDCILCLV